jgi:hypothetical protein
MRTIAVVAILGVVALMAWVSLKVNRLTRLVETLDESWRNVDKDEEDEA